MDSSGASSADADFPLYRRNRHHDLVDSLSFVDAVPVELEARIRELISDEKRAILEEFGGDEEALLQRYIQPIGSVPDLTTSGHMYHLEVERKARGEPLQGLNLDKYTGYDHVNDINERLDHIRVLSEYAHGAQMNLELMDRYKEAAWLRHLEDLSSMQSSMIREKSRLESAIEQLNKDRKVSNIEWAGRLRTLTQEYDDYQNRNRQLLLAIERLQNNRQDSGATL
ncbi:pre-mRNA-splicing factor SPF27 related [Babesia ovis]|uniref:Pre-mRNA-splicing factor SPF27 related n=1 Tax=Babesia ovis TaxID=5869 RepID=A0A9W5TE70_BABOV|nr:pre-mRNA-splicing factor SPF27 related [Babesia ovis]